MKSFLITDDRDALIGLRLAGIQGIFATKQNEMKKSFRKAIKNNHIGIIILTENVFNEISNEVLEEKTNGKIPLVITIPNTTGLKDKNFITRYAKESIGTKI